MKSYPSVFENSLGALFLIDAKDILDHFDAENVYERSGELIHSCLIDRVKPHHSHGDSSPSASMNVKTKSYHCWSYGGGNLLWLLEEMKGSLPEAISELSKMINDAYANQSRIVEKIKELIAGETNEFVAIPEYSDRLLKAWEGLIHPYLLERGLKEEVLNEYRVGWSETENRIIMPHFFKGKLVGWQRRAIPQTSSYPGTEPDDGSKIVQKYKNSSSFPKSTTLFNYDKAIKERSVIVTEGVLRVYKAEGFEGRPFNVVSSFSSKVSKEQASLLAGFESVYLMLDNDFSGYSGAYWAIRYLAKRTNVFYITPNEDGKDLDELTPEQVELMYEKAVPATLAIPYLKSKLERR